MSLFRLDLSNSAVSALSSFLRCVFHHSVVYRRCDRDYGCDSDNCCCNWYLLLLVYLQQVITACFRKFMFVPCRRTAVEIIFNKICARGRIDEIAAKNMVERTRIEKTEQICRNRFLYDLPKRFFAKKQSRKKLLAT